MSVESIILIIVLIMGLLGVGLYFLNKWASKKTSQQQSMIEKNKQIVNIYIIDKKHDYAKNINLPKVVSDHLPKIYKFMKMYFVQAKIGPQIMTLMCDKKVYNNVTAKKNLKVELAGIYIIKVVGMKSEEELKQIRKEKKEKEKQAKKDAKNKK